MRVVAQFNQLRVEGEMNQEHMRKILTAGFFLAPLAFSWGAFAQSTVPAAAPKPESSPPTATSDQWTTPAQPALASPPPAPVAVEPNATSQTAPSDPAPPPRIQLASQAPAPTPVVARTDRMHDGFYVRMSFGFGSQSTTIDDGVPAPNFKATDVTLVFNGLVGGAPAPGVILGGSLALDNLPSTTFEADADRAKTGATLFSIGPFIDGYPDPRGGFHLGGTIGPSFARLTSNAGFTGTKARGISLAAWLGYDWWVADQWAVGGLFRLSGANNWSSSSSPDLAINTRSIALLFTAVYQ